MVICGDIKNCSRLRNAIETIFERDKSHVKIILLAREALSVDVKAILNEAQYRDRVYYIVGKGLDVEDYMRVDLKHASAAFIFASDSDDCTLEDAQNVQRAWGFDDFAPHAPLYVEALSTEGANLLHRTCNAVVCFEEIKQKLLGLNCMHRGAGTLIVNLLQKITTFKSYTDPWQAQYADGAANSIHEIPINPLFVSLTFPILAHYLFKEFQVVLIGVNYLVENSAEGEQEIRHVILNPSNYSLEITDNLIIVANDPLDLDPIIHLTESQYQNSANDPNFSGLSSLKKLTITSSHAKKSGGEISIFEEKKKSGEFVDGFPQQYSGAIHKCILRDKIPDSVQEIMFDSADNMNGHILVCTRSYKIFSFLASLRSYSLIPEEMKRVLILCPELPSNDEFEMLSVFPEVFILIGEPQKRAHLEKAGVYGASSIVITKMEKNSTRSNDRGGTTDSSAMMVSHIIFDMFCRAGCKMVTIIDLDNRNNLKFLRPTARKLKSRQNRILSEIGSRFADNDEVLNSPFFSASYASGGALSSRMLESVLYKHYYQPKVTAIIRAFCGTANKNDYKLEKACNIKSARIFCVDVPDEYIDQNFEILFRSLSYSMGIIPIGVLREGISIELGNVLPFLITNPLPSMILRKNDLIYVIASSNQLHQ